MRELVPGEEFAGLRIDAVAGRGGMGIVYVATHLALDRRVALKVIAPELAQNAEFRERFKRESRLAAAMDHPNVIPILHAGEDGGHLYVTMRYVEGEDLRALIARSGRLEPALAAGIVSQVAAALDAAHSKGLVHRDVKPANVLLEWRDRQPHAYLTDFGLTKHMSDTALTSAGQVVGTVDYMAPEQITGQRADSRADIYALGCVLYHALAGCVPFQRDTPVAAMYAHTHTPPPPLRAQCPDVPQGLEEVVARAMAKDPAARYASAGDLGRAATAAAAGGAVPTTETSVAVGEAAPTVRHAPPPPPAPPQRAPEVPTAPLRRTAPTTAAPRRGRTAWVLAALAALALAVGGGAVLATTLLDGDDEGSADTADRDTPDSDSDRPRRDEDGRTAQGPDRVDYETYSSTGGGYEAELPAGPDWSSPVETNPNSEIHRTRVDGPEGMAVLIDSTPNVAASVAPGTPCEDFDHPVFPIARECTLEGADLPECAARCVDVLLNAAEDGPGYAVLVGGGSFQTAQTIARRVARSLTPR